MSSGSSHLRIRQDSKPSHSLDPGGLVEGLQSGRLPVLGQTFEAFYQELYGVALSLTGSPSEAEDVVQDVFLNLLTSIRTFEGRSSLRTWLRRVTTFRALAYLRARRRRAEVELTYEPSLVPDELRSLVDRIALERAIARLPRKYRVVLVLREIEGRPHDEIASMLGITRASSHMRLSRARRMLRERLDLRAGSKPPGAPEWRAKAG